MKEKNLPIVYKSLERGVRRARLSQVEEMSDARLAAIAALFSAPLLSPKRSAAGENPFISARTPVTSQAAAWMAGWISVLLIVFRFQIN